MGKKDPRVDAVIAKSSGFAKPILVHIRKVVHETCPDVEETLKWQLHRVVPRGEVRRDAGRASRVGWISQGKSRNWKYEKC